LTPEQREAARLRKNAKQREHRARMAQAKDAAKEAAKRAGVKGDPEAGAFIPTAEDRARVETLSGLGMRHDEISLVVINPASGVPVNEKTMRDHFPKELGAGVVKANSKVAESLFDMAVGRNGVARSATAAMFWLKCRAGWRETQHVEIEVKSGVLIAPAATSPEDWVAAAHAANGEKTEPGKKPDTEAAA
tara:strand:+ start:4747 stop:5319 length:573 start_codon:yes stop_codon:yes gene_type:complete